MTSISSDHSPPLFDGQPILELLVPIELEWDYQQGLAFAARLAGAWQVPVRIVHVRTGTESGKTVADVTEAFRALHPDLLVDGVEVESADIASGIERLSTERSLVVLASERASQWLDAESVGEAIVHGVHDMAILCGPGCDDPPVGTSIVVPLDGSTRAEAAIPPAVALAANAGSTLWVVTAVTEATTATVAELRAEGQEVSESAYIRSVAERLEADGIDVGWEVVHHPDPVTGIVSFARDQGAAMVVAATHGDSGVARRVFGSFCMGLVEQGPVPVLIVKTENEPRDAIALTPPAD